MHVEVEQIEILRRYILLSSIQKIETLPCYVMDITPYLVTCWLRTIGTVGLNFIFHQRKKVQEFYRAETHLLGNAKWIGFSCGIRRAHAVRDKFHFLRGMMCWQQLNLPGSCTWILAFVSTGLLLWVFDVYTMSCRCLLYLRVFLLLCLAHIGFLLF